MTTQLWKVTVLFLGLAFIIGHASLAYAYGGGGFTGDIVIHMFFLGPGLAIASYLLMVNEIPQRLLGLFTRRRKAADSGNPGQTPG